MWNRGNNLVVSSISCLRENRKSYILIALFYFLHSILSKCNDLARDDLEFGFKV